MKGLTEKQLNARLLKRASKARLFEALLKVQEALACFRDGEPFVYEGCELTVEELKYEIVDPALGNDDYESVGAGRYRKVGT